jgi:hypothetical protein
MKLSRTTLVGCLAVALGSVGCATGGRTPQMEILDPGDGPDDTGPAIVERWSPADPTPRTFEKIAVVGIRSDREFRHRIENKLVSHLRGREIMAVASYTVVENLAAPGDPQEILDRILAEGIDGVITIRAVPLPKPDDERQWAGSWRGEWEAERPLRPFVADSLPLSAKQADRYGLDFAVWHGSPAHAVWAGRTEVYAASRLRSGSADVVQSVIDAFEDAELF